MKNRTLLLVGMANLLSFAEAIEGGVAGNAPTNQPTANVNDRKLIRVDASKMHFGSKQNANSKVIDNAAKLPPLPPAQFLVEPVTEGEFAGAVRCTAIQYGWPQIKEKEENKGGTLTGRIVHQLDLAQTRTPVPVMIQTDENERGTRMYIDYDVVDEETGEARTEQFAVTARVQFYGKASESVVKRSDKAAPKGAQAAQGGNRQAQAAQR